jgi:hypothetical protein
MNRGKLAVALTLTVLPAGCASPVMPAATAQIPADFAFVFEYGMCGTDILDTFENTYTKDMLVEPSVEIPLALTIAEMQAIYKKMAEIDFYSYPSDFQIAAPNDQIVVRVTPAMKYRFTVRNGGQFKVVQWTDDIVASADPEAENLRELARFIAQIVQSHVEVQKLSTPSAVCQ